MDEISLRRGLSDYVALSFNDEGFDAWNQSVWPYAHTRKKTRPVAGESAHFTTAAAVEANTKVEKKASHLGKVDCGKFPYRRTRGRAHTSAS